MSYRVGFPVLLSAVLFVSGAVGQVGGPGGGPGTGGGGTGGGATGGPGGSGGGVVGGNGVRSSGAHLRGAGCCMTDGVYFKDSSGSGMINEKNPRAPMACIVAPGDGVGGSGGAVDTGGSGWSPSAKDDGADSDSGCGGCGSGSSGGGCGPCGTRGGSPAGPWPSADVNFGAVRRFLPQKPSCLQQFCSSELLCLRHEVLSVLTA